MGGRLTMAVVVAVTLVFGFVAAAAAGERHIDRVGDVTGGAGPDIAAVEVARSGRLIRFRVEFAKAAPFTFSARQGFTDMLLVSISVHGKRDPKLCDYFLGVHAATLPRVTLFRRSGGPRVDVGAAVVAGRSVTLSLDSRRIGTPGRVMFAVTAGREFNKGTGGGGDSAPDHGSYTFTPTAPVSQSR